MSWYSGLHVCIEVNLMAIVLISHFSSELCSFPCENRLTTRNIGTVRPPLPIPSDRVGDIPITEYTLFCCSKRPFFCIVRSLTILVCRFIYFFYIDYKVVLLEGRCRYGWRHVRVNHAANKLSVRYSIQYHSRLIISTPPLGKWSVPRRFATLIPAPKLAVMATLQPSLVLGIEIFGVQCLDAFINVFLLDILSNQLVSKEILVWHIVLQHVLYA